MIIHGLQKLTLLDFPGRTACTVFTAGCNLRCPFCHNASLTAETGENGVITEDEFFSFLEKRKGLLDGVCITGGEPLMRKDIKDFIIKIKQAGFKVKLDTNGFLTSRLKELVEENLLDFIAMDIKNSPEKYALTSGAEGLDLDGVYESIKTIMNSGLEYEFRTTAVKEFHTKTDFYAIAGMIRGAKAYYIQNFVDSGDTIVKGLHPLTKAELEEAKAEAEKILTNVQIRGI
jgi:pyruvate formate lyase activating enzyme